MASIIENVRTYADGFGRWQAEVTFAHSLSESDNRPEFNLDSQWSKIRRHARNAIVEAISVREQKASETLDMAKNRVRQSLGRLSVTKQNISSMNTWYGVTLGEI